MHQLLWWLKWSVYLYPRIVLWPVLWYDRRQRRLGCRLDQWHPYDTWLVGHGHVVRTFGYWFWERPKAICWWCITLWIQFFCLVYAVNFYWAQYVS